MVAGAVKVQGLKELNRALRKGATGLDLEIKELHKVSAEMVMKSARADPNFPERSGKLKASMKVLASKRRGAVKAGKKAVPYAGPIHFGWEARGIRAQPFLYNALARERKKVEIRFLTGVNKVIKLAFKQAGTSRYF